MAEEQPTPVDEQKPTKGYGKRPMWQWVVLYLVVAIVVYGLVYLLFFHHHSTGGGGSGY